MEALLHTGALRLGLRFFDTSTVLYWTDVVPWCTIAMALVRHLRDTRAVLVASRGKQLQSPGTAETLCHGRTVSLKRRGRTRPCACFCTCRVPLGACEAWCGPLRHPGVQRPYARRAR
jgi:hypothetical protein